MDGCRHQDRDTRHFAVTREAQSQHHAIVVPVAITEATQDGTFVDLNCPALGSGRRQPGVHVRGNADRLRRSLATATVHALAPSCLQRGDRQRPLVVLRFTINPVGNETATVDDDRDGDRHGSERRVGRVRPRRDALHHHGGGRGRVHHRHVDVHGRHHGVGTSTFTPTAGQAVTCAITNDVVVQLPPPIADIAVIKTATPTVVTPGGNVTWTL